MCFVTAALDALKVFWLACGCYDTASYIRRWTACGSI